MFARDIHVIENHAALLADPKAVEEVRAQIRQGDVFIGKGVMEPGLVNRIKDYFEGIGRYSLLNYEPIREGCPNCHRINYWDERSHVKGCFQPVRLFSWNQYVFNLFERTRGAYYMKTSSAETGRTGSWAGPRMRASYRACHFSSIRRASAA